MLNLPDHSETYHDAPIFTASDLLAQRWRTGGAPQVPPPHTVVLCYQRAPFDQLRKRLRTIKVQGFFGKLDVLKNGRVGVMGGIGPGAPIVAAVLEELCAFGVKRCVSIGLAGALQPERVTGDIVLCDRAIRDEGTSYHYLPPARWAEASPALVQRLGAALSDQQLAFIAGSSWTTDAPYRETRGEVERYRAEGVQTVEMEAAALFAVGQRLGVQTAAILVSGDRLADLTWQPPADSRVLQRSLNAVAEAIVESLTAE